MARNPFHWPRRSGAGEWDRRSNEIEAAWMNDLSFGCVLSEFGKRRNELSEVAQYLYSRFTGKCLQKLSTEEEEVQDI